MTDQTLTSKPSIHSTDQYGEFAPILDDLWHRYAQADVAAEQHGYWSDRHNERADERYAAYKATKQQAVRALAYREAVSDASREPVLLPVAEREMEVEPA